MIDAQQLGKISSLLDAALTLAPQARAAFLAQLPEADAQFKEVLHKMLALSEQDTGMIDQLPPLDHLPEAGSLSPGDMVDGYRLLRELGHGGMGTVWLAERADGLIRRTVALKLPLVNMPHRTLLQRFERERAILGALSHPHIARLYDAGISKDGQPYLVMEYVEGVAITDYCDAKRLTIPQRLRLFKQVLDAVQYAHASLIIHRDLKPANILVTDNGEVRLLDFGIAKLLAADDAADLTGFAGAPLTLDYASPEQLLSEPVNIASDIYSLSALLYELLSGERPRRLAGLMRGEAQQPALAQPPRPPSAALAKASSARFDSRHPQLVRQLKGDLDTVILKGLKRDPAERYATVDALSEDLQRWENQKPVRARPDSRWYRARRFMQRNTLAVSLSALAVLSLSAGLAVALWQADNAQREARAAVATEAFLTSLFKANSQDQDDPVQAQRTTATVLLQRGSERIMAELNNSPETKLRILKTLASLNQDLGLNEPGYLLQRQRLELFRSLHPRPSAALAAELVDAFFAANASEAGLAISADYLRQAEQMLDQLGDRSSPLRGHLEVGKAYQLTSDNCTAMEHSQRGVEMLRRGPPSEDLTDGLLVLATNQTHCGNSEKALATLGEAIRVMQQTGRRAKLYYAYATMSDTYSALGQHELAIRSGRDAIAAAQTKLGPHDVPSSNLLAVASNLIKKLVSAHPRAALDVAEPLSAAAMKDLEHSDKDSLVSLMTRQAAADLALDRGPAALAVMQQIADILATFAAEDGLLTLFHDARAGVYTELGMLEPAEQELKTAAALHARLHHTGSTQMNLHILHRVDYQLRRGDAAQAQRELAAFVLRKPDKLSPARMDRDLRTSQIALARRDWAGAATGAKQLADDAARYPSPLFVRELRAKALEVHGRALQALGQGKDAAAALAQAAAIHADMLAGTPAI
jgi:serine/threonine-protein kinase